MSEMRMIRRTIVMVYIIALSFNVSYADRLGLWSTIQASCKLIDGFTTGASEEIRAGTHKDESPKHIDELHSTVFIDWRALSFLSLGIQDDLVCLRNNSDARYRHDNRPGLNAALHVSSHGWSFMNRSRFIMRDLQDARSYFRYRNLSKVVAPSICSFKNVESIRPYVSYEWYFDEGNHDICIHKGDKFSQFWTDFGLQLKLSKACSMSLFYRLVEVKSDEAWNPLHVVGTSLSFSF